MERSLEQDSLTSNSPIHHDAENAVIYPAWSLFTWSPFSKGDIVGQDFGPLFITISLSLFIDT